MQHKRKEIRRHEIVTIRVEINEIEKHWITLLKGKVDSLKNRYICFKNLTSLVVDCQGKKDEDSINKIRNERVDTTPNFMGLKRIIG